ncbi:hypothetical protein [Propylenella binzhouense]|uniref:Uncharacterized protein n=1 Tax=Propylenella binzhouense TaxID=2555902 RepID=A0A964WS08_9HYPH|nr:hypothetical protein [Propylenella binzhouense]MYZ46473.1 hypothetical protein [Propylenella binzhouense]
MKIFIGASIAALLMAGAAHAGEEPYGQGFDGWRFTQQDVKGGAINCRAIFQNLHLMSISTNGNTYVSTSSNGLAKGHEEEGNINIGGDNELVQIYSGGQGGRLVISGVDRYLMEKIVKNRGYTWTASFGGKQKTGTVKFNNSTAKAYKRLNECVAANGG